MRTKIFKLAMLVILTSLTLINLNQVFSQTSYSNQAIQNNPSKSSRLSDQDSSQFFIDRAQIAVMPLPEWTPPLDLNYADNKVAILNLSTFQEEQFDFDPTQFNDKTDFSTEQESVSSKDYNDKEPVSIEQFTSLQRVTNPERYPWRMTVKLFMLFPNGSRYQASGVLIGSRYVLTAGHCIYSHQDGGWASSIQVIPGYENWSFPYGLAMATYFSTWSKWIRNKDYDWDIGVIVLDRLIGSSTSWHQIGYFTDNASYLKYAFSNPSYPADYPYNGQYMYTRSGTFDRVYSDRIYHNSRSYGGQSGSGANRYFTGWMIAFRATYAVLSHSNGYQTGYTRITQYKYNWISSIISGNMSLAQTPGELNPSPFSATSNTSAKNNEIILSGYQLSQNYPNPFNPTTNIRFSIGNPGFVIIKIYNALGKEVATLAEGEYPTGEHEVTWNAKDLPGGCYFCQIKAGGFAQTRKMILLK